MVVSVDTMARVVWSMVVLLGWMAVSYCAVPGNRVKRGYNSGYNSGYGDSSSGYGRGSDERDASVSEEGGGCGGSGGGYGRGYSGSRELAYQRNGRSSDARGTRSFTKSAASAVASASAYTVNQKANVV